MFIKGETKIMAIAKSGYCVFIHENYLNALEGIVDKRTILQPLRSYTNRT
jgi:hypothetical protein